MLLDTSLNQSVSHFATSAAKSPPTRAATDAYRALDDADIQAQFSRPAAQPHHVESWLVVEGMVCASCAQVIERELGGMSGVASVDVNAAAGRARLVWNTQLTAVSTLFAAIAALNYRPFPVQQISVERCGACSSRASA